MNLSGDIYGLQQLIRVDAKVDPIQKLWLIEKAEELAASNAKNKIKS